jgi:hypothetical protein
MAETNKKRKRVLQDNLDRADNGTPEWALMKLMQLASEKVFTQDEINNAGREGTK